MNKRDNSLEFFQKWLDKYVNFERAPDAKLFRLETTARLAELLGHPERSYKTYHIAGSKGKGSLSKMLACILQEMDQEAPVGVYASPHVYDFRERVGAASGFLTDDIYGRTVEDFTRIVDGMTNVENPGSWFELNAAFAFLCFKNAGCRQVVFEVGMGGRLDATNVIRPEICGVTEIELEHTQFLGDTLEKIAYEKAGIIKEGVPVVVAQKTESVREVFREVAARKHAPLYFVDELAEVRDCRYEDGVLRVEITGEIFRRPLDVKLRMLNKVQAYNAMQAAVMVKLLYPDTSEDAIERGLMKAVLPGRFEVRGEMVLDGAHTPESVRETLETFDELYPNRPRHLLFGAVAGKEIEKMVPLFEGKFEKIFVTRPGEFKKADLDGMKKAFGERGMEIMIDEDYRKIIQRALAESAGVPLLVTGSFYLLDEVNKIA